MRFIPPIIRFGIILLIAFLALLTSKVQASDMDCFNKEVAQMQLKQAKGLSAKVKARRMVNDLTLFCNQSKQ